MGKTLINMFVLVSDIPAVNSDISKTIYPLLGNGFLEQSHSIYLRYSRWPLARLALNFFIWPKTRFQTVLPLNNINYGGNLTYSPRKPSAREVSTRCKELPEPAGA